MIKDTGVEKVYKRLVFKDESAVFWALFKRANNSYCGWCITRKDEDTYYDDVSYLTREHGLVLVGFIPLNDSNDTEAELDLMVDALITRFKTTFENEDKLGGVCILSGPPKLITAGWRIISETLCNYCEIRIMVKEEEAKT